MGWGWVRARHKGGALDWDGTGTVATTDFSIISARGVASVERTGQGTYKIKFDAGYYETAQAVQVTGLGSYARNYFVFPVGGTLHDTTGVTGNTITTSNDVQEMTVTFYSDFDTLTLGNIYKRNPTIFQLYFY